MSRRPIGIDLGTTRSVVATLEGGRPKAIPNAEGQLCTPSVVAFTADGKVMVGQTARRQAMANPERTIASVKRHLGSHNRFRIGPREYLPQEIAAFILRQLKEDAEAYLGEPVAEAVIGVPAYFNHWQREATRQAAHLAGLRVLRLMSEPTVAALAYGLDREEVRTVMVWDLGGGTFDVSILEVDEGVFEVKAVSGDNSLGGDDFDRRLVEHLAHEYRRASGTDCPQDAATWEQLREAAERAKVQLSSSHRTRVFIPFLVSSPAPRHLDVTLTRGQLEELLADLVQRLIPPTRQALADASLTRSDIDRVVLVGNGTKMPAVRRLVADLLGQEPYRYLDPDLVTAMGAAIQAGALLGQVERAIVLDVLPLSLGLETQGGLFARLIPRNTPLPASAGQVFTTAADGQTAVDIHVLQGERELAANNISLGSFRLAGFPSLPRGAVTLEVALEADMDGLVHVTATDLLREEEVTAKFVGSKSFDPREVEDLLRKAQQHRSQDQDKREWIRAGIEADNAIAAAEAALAALAYQAEKHQVERLAQAVWRVREALASGVAAEIRDRCAALRVVLANLHAVSSTPAVR